MFKHLNNKALHFSHLSNNLVKMSSDETIHFKLDNINNEIFQNLIERTKLLKKERVFIYIPDEFLKKTNFEKSFPLIYGLLKNKYRFNSDKIEARVFQKNYLEKYKNFCKNGFNISKIPDGNEHKHEQKDQNNITVSECDNKENEKEEETIKRLNDNNSSNNTYLDDAKEKEKRGSVDFLESLVQLKIPLLNNSEQNYLLKHVIELVDSTAAETVYRHYLGAYHENDNDHFVTALFNNLKTYKTSEAAHEFNFSLDPSLPITINSYIVHAGTTSYILKIDFFQNDELIFDLYSTFVNINRKTFKPQSVLNVYNFTENEDYKKVKTFAKHLKTVQNLFNHKTVKDKHLLDTDVSFVREYFKDVEIQKVKDIHLEREMQNYNIYVDTDLTELNNSKLNKESEISLLKLFNTESLSFFIGTKNYLCKNSYVESNYFITSEFKNIHNFTFGGYLAHLSFCHAFAVIKKFFKKPVLVGINEIQYILPVPYNTTILYKGKVVYSSEKEIYIKICAYCYDVLKNVTYLTTTFDLSFQNNEGVAFIPESNEEVKLFLFSHMRSLLLQ